MTKLVISRLASLVGILIALSVIVFLLESVIPADPVRVMVGASATRQTVDAKRHELGLDDPVPVQYIHFIKRAATGASSMTPSTRRPVTEDLADFLPATLELAGAAALMAAVLGL